LRMVVARNPAATVIDVYDAGKVAGLVSSPLI
jgi:hypothetical protein